MVWPQRGLGWLRLPWSSGPGGDTGSGRVVFNITAIEHAYLQNNLEILKDCPFMLRQAKFFMVQVHIPALALKCLDSLCESTTIRSENERSRSRKNVTGHRLHACEIMWYTLSQCVGTSRRREFREHEQVPLCHACSPQG